MSAIDTKVFVQSVNGLLATVSTDRGALLVDRQLPSSSNPAPSSTAPPPPTTPASQPASGSNTPATTPLPSPTNPPSTTTSAPKMAGRVDFTLVSVRELNGNMSEVFVECKP